MQDEEKKKRDFQILGCLNIKVQKKKAEKMECLEGLFFTELFFDKI